MHREPPLNPSVATTRFRAYPQFNAPELLPYAGSRVRSDMHAHDVFASESLFDRLARAIAAEKVLPTREIIESAELFVRVRRRLRRRTMADLMCGHGLVGLLFALTERRVERVLLVDQRRPASFDRVLRAVSAIGPWVEPKIEYVEAPLAEAKPALARCESLVAVHACGLRTDRCLDVARDARKPIAVMPCCYKRTATRVPGAIVDAVGAELATDIDRTYRMQAAGFDVAWAQIPDSITAHHRIVVALPRD